MGGSVKGRLTTACSGRSAARSAAEPERSAALLANGALGSAPARCAAERRAARLMPVSRLAAGTRLLAPQERSGSLAPAPVSSSFAAGD